MIYNLTLVNTDFDLKLVKHLVPQGSVGLQRHTQDSNLLVILKPITDQQRMLLSLVVQDYEYKWKAPLL